MSLITKRVTVVGSNAGKAGCRGGTRAHVTRSARDPRELDPWHEIPQGHERLSAAASLAGSSPSTTDRSSTALLATLATALSRRDQCGADVADLSTGRVRNASSVSVESR